MCFSKTGWQQLLSMFNTKAGKDWTHSPLKNYWFQMLKEYQQLHEILHCTVIEYDHLNIVIVADEWWCDRKIELFGDAYDSEKYDVSLSKLSKKGFDDDELWEWSRNSDKLSVNAKMRDEHAPSDVHRRGSDMDISGLYSRDKRRCSSSTAKEKKQDT
ncbi:L10-interacting MYB domain-containing protein-like [Abeliophyllum distichum]|uniref:L10-interacting MYB domain-containing protein-like n=1 Tax=Abeliophyllum distichum TaxID=126358 RepID=A0ABD1RTD8_9LAMI